MVEMKKFNMEIDNLVDKSLVHKSKTENVHIYNLRRALHRVFSVDEFEKNIKENLELSEMNYLEEFYIKKNNTYILRSIPLQITQKRAEDYLNNIQLKEEEIKFLLSYYDLNNNTNKYELKNNLTEFEELKILNILDLKEFYISDLERFKLSNILEKIPDIEKKTTFFGNLFVDQNHFYFFEHPQEHVPGMLILEAGRQFLIAGCHIFGNVPLDGMSFMLTKMNVRFLNYVELNYPIKLRAKFTELNINSRGYWSYFANTVTVYQKNKESAIIEYEASIIPKKFFERLREDKDEYDQLPRFLPLQGFEGNISLRHNHNKYLCSIIDISKTGFMLKFEKDDYLKTATGTYEENKIFEFFLFFPKIGFVHGTCKLKWSDKREDNFFVSGFQITQIDKLDLENLKEAIKLYFRLKQEREII